MVIYQNSIAYAWVIHWKRKEDIAQPRLDGTRLGAHSMADRLPTLLERVCNIPLWRTYKNYSLRTLASKWSGFYDDKTSFSLWCVELYDRIFLLPWCRQVLLTQFLWVCRVSDLEDAEASMELPWTPDWVREWGIWVVSFIMMLFHFDDVLLIRWYVADMIWRDGWWCRLTIACRPDSHIE